MRGNALILQPEIHNKTQNHCMKEYMRYRVTTIGAMMLCLSAWAQDSVLYQLMVENLQDWRMPHADIIKEENIKTFIKDWIDNGAKE